MENKKIIKARELRKGDTCVIKDEVYKITAIWIIPTLTTNGLFHKKRFILYCENDKTKTEKIYINYFELEINTNNGYIRIK